MSRIDCQEATRTSRLQARRPPARAGALLIHARHSPCRIRHRNAGLRLVEERPTALLCHVECEAGRGRVRNGLSSPSCTHVLQGGRLPAHARVPGSHCIHRARRERRRPWPGSLPESRRSRTSAPGQVPPESRLSDRNAADPSATFGLSNRTVARTYFEPSRGQPNALRVRCCRPAPHALTSALCCPRRSILHRALRRQARGQASTCSTIKGE